MTDEKNPPGALRVEFPVRSPLGEIHIISPRERRGLMNPDVDLSRESATTHAPARNPIDQMAEFEYAPNIVPPDRLPSPGAALRQLCRSIDSHPNLKRLIEDHLAKCNSESHQRYRQTEALKTQLVYAQDEVTGLSGENARLGEKLTEFSATIGELRAEIRSLKLAEPPTADEPPTAAEPPTADLEALGNAARASFLSLTSKDAPAAATPWPDLPDEERAAWCAAALASVLGRDMALEKAKDGWSDR